MRAFDVLIIGGGVAGTTAAETFRAGNADATVAIVSDEPHPLYSRVLLPHAVKGKVPDANVFLKKEAWYAERLIETLFGRSALRVSPHPKTVALDGGEELGYGKLVIAVGGKPRDLGVPGDHLPGVLHLQTYEDVLAVRTGFMPGTELVIIGTGFIGLEFAAIAINKGMKAVMLNRGPHLWASTFGPKIAAMAETILREQGIEVRHGIKATGILGTHHVEGVMCSDGTRLPASAVGVGIGIAVPAEPFSGFACDHDGIQADSRLRAHEDIWAAGDCASFEDASLGGLRHTVGNWTNAMAQGRHVGKALLGEDKPFELLTQYTSACVPDLSLICLGETRMRPGVEREETVIEKTKAVEYHRLGGRIIGAILVNAPELRAEALAKIAARNLSP